MGFPRHSSSKELVHPVCKNPKSAPSSLYHQCSCLWHPFSSPSGKRALYEIFFLFSSRAGFLSFLKHTDNCSWHTTRDQSNLQAIIYITFDLLHTKRWCNILQSCQKNKQVMPSAPSMSPATQIPQRFRATWLWRLLLAWHICNQGKMIQVLHSSSKSTSSSRLRSPNAAIHLKRMTCPTERTCCSFKLTNGSVIWENINRMASPKVLLGSVTKQRQGLSPNVIALSLIMTLMYPQNKGIYPQLNTGKFLRSTQWDLFVSAPFTVPEKPSHLVTCHWAMGGYGLPPY